MSQIKLRISLRTSEIMGMTCRPTITIHSAPAKNQDESDVHLASNSNSQIHFIFLKVHVFKGVDFICIQICLTFFYNCKENKPPSGSLAVIMVACFSKMLDPSNEGTEMKGGHHNEET